LPLPVASFAQQPTERVTAEINGSEKAMIPGSHSPLARHENETGRMAANIQLEGLSLVFSRTAEQEADLQALIAAQQDPASPLYRKWLSPEEFGSRFGVADADIAKVQFWLENRGFTIEGVSRSKTRIIFSGTVEQVESSFATELHYYSVEGETHFSASEDISVPTALSSLVLTVTNLSDFRPKPHFRLAQLHVSPNFTSSQSGNHFLTPKDVATIYDINPAYNAGFNGTGQSIAVVAQSDVTLTDIEHFQTDAGFAIKDPIKVLASTTSPGFVPGDEMESDIDLEYTSTIANGATIYFVYSSGSGGAFDSLTYAVENKTAPIISVSYGKCESNLSSTEYSMLNNTTLAQAASQGQSVIVASGDSGSTDCGPSTGLAVDFPAGSQYVTAMGGTEFLSVDVSGPNASSFWLPATSSTVDLVSSAIKYIPEQVWNDDLTNGALASGGGGVSTLTPKPSWQTGVPGIPSGTFRFTPDVSLSSSNVNAPYLLCSSDSMTGITGSCSHGFRDVNNAKLTTAGGTSFAAPIFAAMLAVLNQKLNSTGQGVINSTLYTLAANSTTYNSAFHDITSGGNQCPAGASYCSTAGASEYPATTGYDAASGLGSIDLFNLVSAWPGSSTLATSKTTLVAATLTPAPGAGDAITITVTSGSSSSTATPAGTVTISVDGTAQSPALTLVNGSATYTFSSAVVGSHTITAAYSGNTTYATSTGSLVVTVITVASKTTLSAAATTPNAGANDAITITVTSGSSSSTATPTGTVTISVDGTMQTPALTLVNGMATYVFSSTVVGSHTITASYSGNTTYIASSGSLNLTVIAAGLVASKTTLSASTSTVAAGASDAVTITVASGSSSSTTAPTGTLTIVVDGATQSPALSLTNGSATYTFSSLIGGSHTITATYSGSSTYGTSSGSLSVTVTVVASTTALSAATTTPAVGTSDVVTITVASGSSSSTATPTGSLTITVDGAPQTPTLTLTNGSATYPFSSATVGSHTIAAAYSGDSTYAASTGSVTVAVAAAPKSFKLAVTSLAVPSGSSGTSTVTITPQGGYAGTIAWTVSSSPTLTNGCFSLPNTSVSGSNPVTATLTVFTAASSCPAPAVAAATAHNHAFLGVGPRSSGKDEGHPLSGLQAVQASMAMAGLVLFAFLGRRSHKFGVMAAACILVVIGLAVSGCAGGGGGSSTSSPPTTATPTAAKGMYTVTITGTDASSITQTATMALTVD
jgi:subtilase family serine protease